MAAAHPATAYAPPEGVDPATLPPSDTFEDGKAFFTTAPGTGDFNDPYVLLTGQDMFGRPRSRVSALAATCLPFVTVGMLRIPKFLRGSGKLSIDIIGFRGISPRNWTDDLATGDIVVDDLAQFGHIGVSFDGGRTIYGFRPSQVIMDEVTPESLDYLLRNDYPVAGQVFDDTAAFNYAYELASRGVFGGRTQPYKITIEVSEEEFARMYQQSMAQVRDPAQTTSTYRFPVRDQETSLPLAMPEGTNNCATWCRTLGLPLIENTGQLSYRLPDGTPAGYMEELKYLGTKWIPPQ